VSPNKGIKISKITYDKYLGINKYLGFGLNGAISDDFYLSLSLFF